MYTGGWKGGQLLDTICLLLLAWGARADGRGREREAMSARGAASARASRVHEAR